MRNCLMDQIKLDCEYDIARVTRECALKSQASRYELEFERAFGKLLQRRAEERKQWKEVILPAIKEKAAMAAYERSMAAINHAVVA